MVSYINIRFKDIKLKGLKDIKEFFKKRGKKKY